MRKKTYSALTRMTALLLVLVCMLGLLPSTALAANPSTIKMDDCAYSGTKYDSPALGECYMHQMHFNYNGKSTMGFCAEKGKGMGWSLKGHTWGNPQPISDPTVKTMMAYFYAHSTGVFTDQAKALGVDDVWNSDYTWTMNSWTQAIVWRYKAGLLSDPVTACAEELLCVYNNLEHTNYSSIDDKMDGKSFRDRAQYILDLGAQGVWGECEVYEYAYTGPGSSYHPSNDVQAVMVGKLDITHEEYTLTVKKVDSTNPNKGLSGARFLVASENGAYSKEVVTGADGTATLYPLVAGTYAVTELEAPAGYEIDNAGPQYVVLPNGSNTTVTVTFTDTPEITGEGSIRKVDADNPTKGLAGAVIKITGVDNDFTGTYVTGTGGYLTDVPWKDMPLGSYTAEEITPPEGYSLSPDVSKTKQTFVWDGKTDVALVFENDAKVKIRLIKKDDSDNPLPGAVFNIIKDGQIIGTEATKADGSITVTDVTEGMYAFVEVSAPAPYSCLTEPVFAHLDQSTINGGGTVTVTAADQKLPSLTILKRDAQTKEVIPGTVFEIKGIHYGYHNDVTTGPDGRAVLSNIPVDSYEVVEKSVPDPYVVGEEPMQTIYLGLGENRELIFDNLKQPVLKISKVEQRTNTPIPGTVFTVEGIDSDYRHDVTTEADGFATLRVAPGSYRVTEKSVPDPYCLPENEADRTQTISLNGGDEKTLIFKNSKKPLLTISKVDAISGDPVPGTVLTVEGINSDYQHDVTTGADGTVSLRVDPGTYRITEKSVPAPYYLPDKDADRVQTISLNPGDEKTVVFKNHKAPELTIFKEDSVAGAPIEGAKFHVTYTSNGEAADAPSTIDFGYILTDANGEIKLHEQGKRLYPGEYTITEVAPAPGFQMKEPTTQKVILHGGESKTVTFQNEPLNGIVVEKYDSVTHEALPGCTFQLRYLGGTSGTGGTVIGQKVTGKNGTAIWTGLQSGTYIVEEVDPADGYSIINASETVYISDNGTQSVITVRFDNAPDGILLIRKVCAVNPSITLQNAEFKVMYADGTLIGDSNGIFRTDENGEIRITGLKPGKSVVVTETKAPDGFIIDTQSQTIQIQEGKTVSLTFKNQPKGGIIIQKRDSISGQPLPGAEFRVTTAAGCEVGLDGVIGTSTLTQNGLFTTDSSGEIRISNLAPGAYVLTETKAPTGYVMDAPSTNVVIGANGDTQTVIITNTPKATLTITKRDAVTRKPLANAEFIVRDSEGHAVGPTNGIYKTGTDGTVIVSGLEPGSTIMVSETKAPTGYILDETPKSIVVKSGISNSLIFDNEPGTTLIIRKFIEGTENEPLSGVAFKVVDGSGAAVGPDDGTYYTDKAGEIVLDGIEPGTTVIAREIKTVEGFVLDTTPQSILIKQGAAQTLTFFNKAEGGLELIKVSASDTTRRIPGTTFEIRKIDGALVDTVATDSTGRVHAALDAGDYYAVEIEAAQGFKLDSTPTYFTITDGKTTTLTVKNKPFSGILIHKTDSVTGKGIYGVTFLLYDSTNTPIGQYTSDNSGYVYIEGLTTSGRYYLRELENKGYIPDTQMKTVYVTAGETTLIEWKNTPITAQIQITKKSADYNPTNGLPAGTLLEGAIFEIYDKAGNLVDTIKSDSRGLAASKPLPLGRYTIREVKAPNNYGISGEDLTAYLEHEGEIVRFEVTNKALATGVSITKTGPNQIMAGQPVRYVLSDIANSSNVMLQSFYWRDTLPAEVRLDSIVTGTYNFPGTYKITYRVNGGEYRTLADNLSTSKNYTLAASATALGLASNERVTEIMFVFGQAPAGFAQVEKPMLYCTAISNITTTSFVNVADVGGTYNGVWVQAVSRWVTTVYGKPTPLPRTGY